MAEGIGKGEDLQVHAPRVLAVMAVLLGMATIVAFGFMLLFPERIGVRFVPQRDFPPPGVVADEQARRLALEARQRHDLAGAGGRMPIEQAMRQVVARGTFDPPEP